jgi:translation initiation factor 4E
VEHPLHQSWTFWYLKRDSSTQTLESYEQSLKEIGSFSSIEAFWSLYNYIVKPGDSTFAFDLFCFRSGVKPLWEHPENKFGGKFRLRVQRGRFKANQLWEDLLIALIGHQFDLDSSEICGVSISVKPASSDIISIWNKDASNEDGKKIIHETFKEALKLSNNLVLEYKSHAASSLASQEYSQASEDVKA